MQYRTAVSQALGHAVQQILWVRICDGVRVEQAKRGTETQHGGCCLHHHGIDNAPRLLGREDNADLESDDCMKPAVWTCALSIEKKVDETDMEN